MDFFLLILFLLSSEVLFVYASDNVLKYSELEQEQGVKYLAYARNNLQISVDIRDVSFNDNEPTVFIVHGFESKNLDQPSQLKDDLFRLWLEVERVIIVSWKEYSYGSESTAFQASSDYVNVVQYHVPRLARDIFEKIVHIRKNGANGPIAIIGHGVGAHVAGQTGKLLKKETGYTLDKIIGLDPAVYYFKEHSNSSLQNEDSKNTVRIHTKAYGYGNLSGPNDVKVNGGERQASCKINVDFCPHNLAWSSLSHALKNVVITEKAHAHIHPYVICLDASGSMSTNKRLERAIHSANKVISSLKKGSFIGLVTFNAAATKVHDIVQTVGLGERETLIGSLQINADGGTSIGDGLRLSMNMLVAMPTPSNSTFCSTIVLISDGEQNSGEEPETVLPDLLKNCISVHSIAVGSATSPKLEQISTDTNGLVAYASEDGTSKDLVGNTRALSYLYRTQILKSELLKSEEVTISDEKKEIYFTVDDSAGGYTEFKIVTYDVANLDVSIKSPNGDEFNSSSPEYFYDNFTEKGFCFEYGEEGQWVMTIFINSKYQRRTGKRDMIRPKPVSDLRALLDNANERMISLGWTSPSNDFFDMEIKGYDIRVCNNRIDFDNCTKLNNSHIVKGSLDPTNSTNKMERISVQIPEDIWNYAMLNNDQAKYSPKLKFILKSIGLNNETSEVSNIVSVIIKEAASRGVIASVQLFLNPFCCVLYILCISSLLL